MSLATHRFVVSHADHERAHPDDAAYARRVDPGREWPCPGSIRVVDQSEHHLILACDACRFETTTRVASSDQPAPF